MDAEAIWQAHKPFILRVGGASLALFAALGYQGSLLRQASALYAQASTAQTEVQGLSSQLEGAEGLEKGRAQGLTSRLAPAILGTLLWKQDPELTLPAGERSPLLFYAAAMDKALQRVGQAAATWNADVPRTAAGLGLQAEVQEVRVDEALAQVDLVQSLVRKLLDAGVRQVTKVEPGNVSYSGLTGLGGYLREVPVTVSFQTTTRVLARVLAELQVPGSFLEVVSCSVAREGGRPGDPVVATLALRALGRTEAVPQGRESQGPREQSSRGPRRGLRFGFAREER